MTSHGFSKVPVRIVLTHEAAQCPVYAKEGDAGADVYAVPSQADMGAELNPGISLFDEKFVDRPFEYGDYVLAPGQTVLVDLGLKMALKDGWEMQVRSRSGMALRGLVVANAPGTIDSGYRGPCMVLMRNESDQWRIVKPGTRVAQFVLKRAPQASFILSDSLDETERGVGGFGSTGTK